MRYLRTCIFILGKDLTLLATNAEITQCKCWHDTLTFKDNRLIGIKGVRDGRFRSTIFNGDTGAKNILLRSSKEEDEGSRLLLKISPLTGTPHSPCPSGLVSLEIQTLDTLYSATVVRLSDKFNLTPTEGKVLKCLMLGYSSNKIQEILNIGSPTLQTHKKAVRNKLEVDSSVEAIITALSIENHVDEVLDLE